MDTYFYESEFEIWSIKNCSVLSPIYRIKSRQLVFDKLLASRKLQAASATSLLFCPWNPWGNSRCQHHLQDMSTRSTHCDWRKFHFSYVHTPATIHLDLFSIFVVAELSSFTILLFTSSGSPFLVLPPTNICRYSAKKAISSSLFFISAGSYLKVTVDDFSAYAMACTLRKSGKW